MSDFESRAKDYLRELHKSGAAVLSLHAWATLEELLEDIAAEATRAALSASVQPLNTGKD